jgi:TonB-dependent starch-binding outer membrane protein SusC
VTPYQKFTANIGTPAYNAGGIIYLSDAVFTDASFIRLKNLSLTYTVREGKLRFLQSCRLFLQGQNLFTLTDYNGNDPENQRAQALPPLRTLSAGLLLTF